MRASQNEVRVPAVPGASVHWPLLSPWKGDCHATGAQQPVESPETLHGCNFGYAAACPQLPADRPADRISFQVARDRDGALLLAYVLERDHLPVVHGTLLYDVGSGHWRSAHVNHILLRQAECYLSEYVARRAAHST